MKAISIASVVGMTATVYLESRKASLNRCASESTRDRVGGRAREKERGIVYVCARVYACVRVRSAWLVSVLTHA